MILAHSLYKELVFAAETGKKQLAVLIDPEKFNEAEAEFFLNKLPANLDFILVGGSTVEAYKTEKTVKSLKAFTSIPIILFPGDYTQITEEADALLFLSLISGRNPEYLIEQQVKSVAKLKSSNLQIIPTGYILIDGGSQSSVQQVSNTLPILQSNIEAIVNTALAGQFSGKSLIYLEAGSGAENPVSAEVISEVKNAIEIPLIVGGGIRSVKQLERTYEAGADVVVIGTAFERGDSLY